MLYFLLSACEALTEWEYLPPVGPRSPKGFVGLKNAGATCYMNSVIQQLYMIPLIRNSILAIESIGSNIDDYIFKDEKHSSKVSFNHFFFIIFQNPKTSSLSGCYTLIVFSTVFDASVRKISDL